MVNYSNDELLLIIRGFSDGLYFKDNELELSDEVESIEKYLEEKKISKQQIKEVFKMYIQQTYFVEDVFYCDHCGPCVSQNFVNCLKCKTELCEDDANDFNNLCESCC